MDPVPLWRPCCGIAGTEGISRWLLPDDPRDLYLTVRTPHVGRVSNNHNNLKTVAIAVLLLFLLLRYIDRHSPLPLKPSPAHSISRSIPLLHL